MDALDRLIEQHGPGAILAVYPYMPDNSGDIFRWDVQIDGKTDANVDVRLLEDGEYRALVLALGTEEFELFRWNPHNPRAAVKEPGSIIWSLRQVREVVDRSS
jgi:hypothetical protein